MALMERVTTLVRANLNDLINRAEDPEKLIKQVILDMQNQLIQVKTQVAIAIADQHLLAKKQKEHEHDAADWVRKAELAVDKKQDDLARVALERSLGSRNNAENFRQQTDDQKAQVENLKQALHKLEQKLGEAQAKSELLISRHRRARAMRKAGEAQLALNEGERSGPMDRMKDKVLLSEARGEAIAELTGATLEDRFAALEKEQEIDRLLADLKSRRAGS